MFIYVVRAMGLAPTGNGKSGKREAAWAFVSVCVLFTAPVFTRALMVGDANVISASSGLLIAMWTIAGALLGGAYKLENDRKKDIDADMQAAIDDALYPQTPTTPYQEELPL